MGDLTNWPMTTQEPNEIMEDLTNMSVTTQELNDWLRSTSVDDGAGGGETRNELGEVAQVPVLPELSPPPPLSDCDVVARATVGQSQRQHQRQKQGRDNSPRRSSLDDTNVVHSFGIDERAMLMTIDSNDSAGNGKAHDASLDPNFGSKDASLLAGNDFYMTGYTPEFSEAIKLLPPSARRALLRSGPACWAIVGRGGGALDDDDGSHLAWEHDHSNLAVRRQRRAHLSILSKMERSQQSRTLCLMGGATASCADDSVPGRGFSVARDPCGSRGTALQMPRCRGAVRPRARARDKVHARGYGVAARKSRRKSRRKSIPFYFRRLHGEGTPGRWKTTDVMMSATTRAHAEASRSPRREEVRREDPDEVAIRAELRRIARGIH